MGHHPHTAFHTNRNHIFDIMNNADKPAYPIWTEDMPVEGNPGLTKRERFAMAAMQGYIASNLNSDLRGKGRYEKEMALMSTKAADALLKALEE